MLDALNIRFYGIAVAQAYFYSRTCQDDPKWLKRLAMLTMCVDLRPRYYSLQERGLNLIEHWKRCTQSSYSESSISILHSL